MAEHTYRLTFRAIAGQQLHFSVELARCEDDGTGAVRLRVLVPAASAFGLDPGWAEQLKVVRKSPASETALEVLDAIAPELWERLPVAVRRHFQPLLDANQRFALELVGPTEIAALPWETICVSRFSIAKQKSVLSPLCERGQCGIVRRWADLPTDSAAPLLANRTALLLIGSLEMPPQARHGDRSIASIANAMRRAGFRVTIAAGRASIAEPFGKDTRIDEVLHSVADLAKLLRKGEFSLLQYIGHSDAEHDIGHSDAENGADPMGAHALVLQIDGKEESLDVSTLAAACRDGGLRVANFAACDLRENAAQTLLEHGHLEHVVTMGAMLPVDAAATYLHGFYASLETQSLVAVAVAAGRDAMAKDDFACTLTWLPQHHRRVDRDLSFAEDAAVQIERYCTGLLAVLDSFEGRFRRTLDPATLADVYVELSIDPQRAEQRSKIVLSSADQQALRQCTFEQLGSLEQRRILLGGKPGAGKSTSLRVHARKLARNGLRPKVPLFVNLPDWLREADAAMPLCEYVARGQTNTDSARAKLASLLDELGQRGELFVCFDGLDELSPDARRTLESRLLTLAGNDKIPGTWHTSRFLVSTRRYEHTLGLPGFLDLDIQELTSPRAIELLGKVLGTRRPARTPEWIEDQCKAWLANFQGEIRAWQEIGKVPLFVTILGELLLAGRGVGKTRVEFFDEVFEHLLFDGHHDRGLRAVVRGEASEEREVRRDAILDLLGRIAWSMNTRTQLTARAADLKQWMPSSDPLLQALLGATGIGQYPSIFLLAIERDTSLFARDARPVDGTSTDPKSLEGTWRFWHRSFQEALVGRELARRLAANESPKSIASAMRLEPTAAEIAAEEQRLPGTWAKDGDAFSRDFNAVYLPATPEQAREIEAHRDPDDRRFRSSVYPVLARLRAPQIVRGVLEEFWRESIAAGLARALTSESPGVQTFCEHLFHAHRSLLRGVVSSLDRCPPWLWSRSLDAAQRSDGQVAAASSGTELYESLTMRLSDRIPLYACAAGSTSAPAGLLDQLERRLSSRDDPGELLLIDDVLDALARVDGLNARVAACKQLLRSRFGRFDPALFPSELFVRIEGGEFDMGSPEGQGEIRERPQHRVRVSSFAIGRTPITVRQYRCFWPTHRMDIGRGVSRLTEWIGKTIENSDEAYDELPVTYVSQLAARMFCRWLNWHLEHLSGARTTERVCLPTEAEWEFATRGGAAEWSAWSCPESALGKHAWTRDNAEGRPHAVGRKLPNPFGIFDLHGDVWEWCEDAYAPYPEDRVLRVDPLVLGSSAAWRVLRGGSFFLRPDLCRSAFRLRNRPAFAYGGSGFRVVLAARSRAGLGHR